MSYSPIPGVKVILIGPPGSGKSTSLTTLRKLLPKGIKVRSIFTDQNFAAGLFPEMDFKYIAPATAKWSSLKKVAQLVNTMSMESIQKMEMGRNENTQYLELLEMCNRYVTSDGKDFGDVSSWGTDVILVFDGLSGISKMARLLTVGGKPNPTQPEWGAMMSLVENFLFTLATASWCHVIVIAHIEPERDEVAGTVKNMISTLGRKLAPAIPKDYTDVILAKKTGAAFTWDTIATNADLKSSHLPFKADLAPDFLPLFNKWEERGGIYTSAAPSPEELVKAYAQVPK